jgi:Fe-S oxidoreductase/electron transfer flavoprotein alpha/beta subunit
VETRELFWSLNAAQIGLFYALGTAAIVVFLLGCWRHIAKYRRGAPIPVQVDLRRGVAAMLGSVLSHRALRRRDRSAGVAHAGIFFGFVLAAIGTTIIFVDYDIFQPLSGLSFWKGNFYLWFSLVLDLGHLVLILGLLVMVARRAAFALPKLDYRRRYLGETELRAQATIWRIEDWTFLSVLLVIEVTGFLQEGTRLLAEPVAWARWSPIGLGVANLLSALGMTPETAAAVRSNNWWLHAILALAFTAAIPWYKAKHMLAVLGSLSLRDPKALRRLPKEPEQKSAAGYSTIADFSWKDMLNLDACTKCGRCHEACPARASHYPLSPRDLILDLRSYADNPRGIVAHGLDLVGGVIKAETLWACLACGACQEICPVGIEHPAMIVQMRRQLVERRELHPLLQSTLGAVANTGNSFNENARKRSAWTRELEFKVKDIREEPAEVLWFVGDYASFDPRNQKVSRTVARILRAAGVDFALLYEGERTAGNDIRRVGEEGLFESLVKHNLAQMTGCKPFSRIITTDPHSYNTIKNEYPEFAQTASIQHYSETLADLLDSGDLKVVKPLAKRVTFHDPCHLGRLNNGYEAPRRVLEAIGCELIEMPRNRDNSFCCGAGGGRIWMPDQPGAKKPSEDRMHEAVALAGIESFITCCPKDLTMFEDARKTSGHENDLVVEDLAELVAEAINLDAFSLKDLPPLAERITEAVAARIADVVAARLDAVLTARLAALPQPTSSEESGTTGPASSPQDPATPAFAARSGAERGEAPVAPTHREPRVGKPLRGEAAEPSSPPVISLRHMDWDEFAPLAPISFPEYEPPTKETLRILVAVKHVAVLGDDYEFTADGRDIQPAYLEHQLNEWDDAALEEALQLIEKAGNGEIVAVCVGPEEAEASLRKVLAKGADRAVRVWHEGLSAADPLTIARGIAGVATKEQPDLILAGAQSGDQANGATGTAVARILGLPHAAVVVGLQWTGDSRVAVTRELEGGVRHHFILPTPALLTIQTGGSAPRYATMRMIKQAKKKPLIEIDGSALLDDGGGYSVRRMYTPAKVKAQMLEGGPEDMAAFVVKVIRQMENA